MRRPLSGGDAYKYAALGLKLQGALPAIALTQHAALSTAFANDVDPSMTFAQQVYGYGRRGDALLAISTSGNSVNVINAVKTAIAAGIFTIGLTGGAGGNLKRLCDVCVTVPGGSVPDIQELHLPVYHALCAMLEAEFFSVYPAHTDAPYRKDASAEARSRSDRPS